MNIKGPTMNLSKKGRYLKSICILTVLLVSGCSLLPEKSTEGAINNADQYLAKKELSSYKAQVEEMLAMRSSLNRLIELEADLTFLLDEMGRFEEQNPNLTFAQEQVEQYAQEKETVYSPDGVRSKLNVGGMNALKFSAPSNIESVGLASSQAKEQAVLDTNRFSNKSAILKKSNVTEVTTIAAPKLNSTLLGSGTEQFRNNKFSNAPSSSFQPNQNIANKNIVCDGIQTNVSNSFAVHLASYGSQKSAITAWTRLRTEHGSELCSDIAKTQTVVVKGKTYYRLNVGGYAQKRFAQTICSKLRKQSTYCNVVEFEGNVI